MTIVNPQLFLDDGTGTFPTEVTDYLSLSGLSVSGYGRQDEFAQANAATLSVTLKNDDGRFTDGTVTLEPGTGIRLTETVGSTTRNRFTGAVDSLELAWPGGIGLAAGLSVTAVDRLADLSRFNLRSMLEQEILALSPSAYYTLGEPEGSANAGDTSGKQAPLLKQTGTGTAVKFGSGTGPSDGMTTATFSGGKTLANDLTPGASYSELVYFSRSSAPTNQEVLLATASEFLVLETSGKASIYSGYGLLGFSGPKGTTSASVCDGGVHQLGFSVESGVGYQFFCDGVTTTTADTGAGTGTHLTSGLNLGGPAGFVIVGVGGSLTGNASHLAHFDGTVLTSTQVASAWSVLDDAETTDDRLSRLASYAGLTATTSTPSGQEMSPQATSGRSLFDAIQEVATAEGGVVFVNGDGGLVMQGRYYRGKKTTADASFGAQEPGIDTSVTWDRQQLINQVTATRTGGATVTVEDEDATYAYPTQLDLTVTDDDDALYAAQWVLGKHKDTQPRLASVTFDLMTSPNAEDIFGLEIGDRISLPDLPSQVWSTAGDYVVEGWTENRDKDSWTLTCNLLPWELFKVFILDDPVYGVLDGTNVLGY